MNSSRLYLIGTALGLLALLPLAAQTTDQDVVDDMPTLLNGDFIIGDSSAFDVTVDASTELLAQDVDSSLTIRNGSVYTASNDDLIATSREGVASITIDGATIDLGRSNGEITGKDDFNDDTDKAANITISGGSSVDIRRFKGQGQNNTDNVIMTVLITGTGTNVRSDDPDALVNTEDTLDITVSSGATYSVFSAGSSHGIKNYTIANGGTLEARDSWNITVLDNFTFNSGGTLIANGAITGLGSISSGRTVDISGGGSFTDATTLTGGSLIAADLDFSNLTFTSGSLTVSGALTNLNAVGSGDTVILDGGSWSPTGSVEDANITLQNSATLSVTGGYDASNLTFTSGSLTISGDASNLPTIVSGTSVELTGSGTLQTATTLNGGTLTGGDFNLDGNLTFTSGTLNVTGTLQNLTHLPSGNTVNMSGASADLILSQELSITGGTLNIDNGASVTVLDDVTFGAGSLGFASSGGNLDLDGGTLNVASMDTALTLNANSSITGNGTIFGDINLGTDGTVDGDETGFNIYGDVSGSGTLADATLFGNLDIGNSPGELTLNGVTLSASSTVIIEILGTNPGEYDTLIADAMTDVSAASLTITFAFSPETSSEWQLISGGIDPTSFNSISAPSGWTLTSLGTLTAVPEPGSAALLLGLGGLAFATTRRRRG